MRRTVPVTLALLLLATLSIPASAQMMRRGNIWKCTLPGGNYEVAIGTITSISTSQYVVDGAIHITELSIDTSGNTQCRIYCMQTLAQAQAQGTSQAQGGAAQAAVDAATQRTQDAVDRVSSVMGGGSALSDTINSTVVKNYPASTHAHTVEYRVATPAQLDDIFKSVEAAWVNNANSTYPAPSSTSTPAK
jgi:hypothetical protein